MARRGRTRWSKRLLVEDCLAFDIAELVRSGVFRAKPGTLCSTVWKNLDGQETFRAYLSVELTASGKTLLHLSYGIPSKLPETIEIALTALYFGPRPWFLCPSMYKNAPCRKRARILYFTPGERRLGCRKCLDLIHKSARSHDKRMDKLLKLNPLELQRVLLDGNITQKLLAVQANIVFLQRLRKKAMRYSFVGQSRSPNPK